LLPVEFACFHSGGYPFNVPFPVKGSNSPDILSVALFLWFLVPAEPARLVPGGNLVSIQPRSIPRGVVNPYGVLRSPDFPRILPVKEASAVLRPTLEALIRKRTEPLKPQILAKL